MLFDGKKINFLTSVTWFDVILDVVFDVILDLVFDVILDLGSLRQKKHGGAGGTSGGKKTTMKNGEN